MAEARASFRHARIAGMEDIVARAVERGELPQEVDAAELLESLVAPVYLRLLVTGMPLDEALIDRSVRTALDVAERASWAARSTEGSNPSHSAGDQAGGSECGEIPALLALDVGSQPGRDWPRHQSGAEELRSWT